MTYLHQQKQQQSQKKEIIKLKCGNNYRLVTGKQEDLQALNDKNKSLNIRQNDLKDSIQLFLERNIFSIQKKENLTILLENYTKCMSCIENLKYLFEILKKIDFYSKSGNFLTAKYLLNYVSKMTFAEAFKVKGVKENIIKFKVEIESKIRDNIFQLQSNFTKQTHQKEREFVNKFLKCSENYLRFNNLEKMTLMRDRQITKTTNFNDKSISPFLNISKMGNYYIFINMYIEKLQKMIQNRLLWYNKEDYLEKQIIMT